MNQSEMTEPKRLARGIFMVQYVLFISSNSFKYFFQNNNQSSVKEVIDKLYRVSVHLMLSHLIGKVRTKHIWQMWAELQ